MKHVPRFISILLLLPILLPAQIDNGGGAWIPLKQQESCIPAAERQAVEAEVATRIAQWTEQGRLQPPSDNIVNFDWPVRAKPGLGYPGFYGIANYVDEDPSAGILDYNCTNRSYDGHKGTDISSWPFAWTMMDNDDVEVVAAAKGVIVAKYDGQFDQQCSWGSNQSANAIILLHPDGSQSWYWHFKKYTLTAKGIGSSVAQGEFLGLVGSSGYSTGPHLHFEVHDSGGATIDPWAGACNNLGGQSWWTDQKPYRDPYILRIMTHDAEPVMGNCPPDTPNAADVFQPGQKIYFGSYFRDRLAGSTGYYLVKQPDGTVWKSWTQTPTSTYSFYWWWWSYTLPANAQEGTWNFRLTANGQIVDHTFTVGNPSGVTSPEALGFSALRLYPNPAQERVLLDITCREAASVRLSLYRADGALVKSEGMLALPAGQSALTIDLPADLPGGVYFLKIGTEKGVLAKRLLVE